MASCVEGFIDNQEHSSRLTLLLLLLLLLLLTFGVTRSDSLIQWSVVLWHARKTKLLHLGLLPERVSDICLELAFQTVFPLWTGGQSGENCDEI